MLNYKNGIYYDVIKNPKAKENLVFIHGSGCNRKFLNALAKQMPDFNCYLPDLPDHGKSNFRDCKKVEDYIEAMAEFVEDIEKVTIIGHSLGGSICLGVAAKQIPSVKKCVIISGGAKFDKMDRKIHKMVEKEQVDWLYIIKCLGCLKYPTVVLDFLNFGPPELIIKDFVIDLKLDLEYTLQDIKIPTLIMVSKDDILTIPEYSKKIKQGIKNARLIYFKKCRHMLPIAKRKEVSKLIRKFVLA